MQHYASPKSRTPRRYLQTRGRIYRALYVHRLSHNMNSQQKQKATADTNMSNSDSEFEQIEDGWSEVDGEDDGRETDPRVSALPATTITAKDEEGSQVVLVEFPESLLSVNNHVHSKAEQDSSIGSASSFVIKTGNLKIDSTDSNKYKDYCYDDEESSAWSYVEQQSGSVADSVAESSTISGFDVLSLSGASKRRCKRCTFLNGEDDGVCGCCGVALLANPSLDADEQIARNLQQAEESFALKMLQTEEKKREALGQESVLIRSQVLVSDIGLFVRNCQSHGVDTLQEASHVILASRFIDSADEAVMNGGRVTLAYHFCAKLKEESMEQIRKDGLGINAVVSTNIEAAYLHDQAQGTLWKRKKRPNPFHLSPIQENEIYGEGAERDERKHVGWIVATIEKPSDCSESSFPHPSGRKVAISSGSAIARTIGNSTESLPLVCFDASLRKDDIIRRLLNGTYTSLDTHTGTSPVHHMPTRRFLTISFVEIVGLSQICRDFFQECWLFAEQHDIERSIAAASPRSKKPRVCKQEDQLSKALEDTVLSTMSDDATADTQCSMTGTSNDDGEHPVQP